MDETDENRQLKELATGIRNYLKKNKTYSFRAVKIDGIYCYIVIHKKYKLINIESIYIDCMVTLDNLPEKQKYSLYHTNYDTIEQAIQKIKKIHSDYKIYNGELISKKDYDMYKLEEPFLPYNEDEKCCVCFENTNDLTTCNHSICLHCREKCLMKKVACCPICRNEDALSIYNINNGLVNNDQHSMLKNAIRYEREYGTNREEYGTSRDDDDDNVDMTPYMENINLLINMRASLHASQPLESIVPIEWHISRTPSYEMLDASIRRSIEEYNTNAVRHDETVPMDVVEEEAPVYEYIEAHDDDYFVEEDVVDEELVNGVKYENVPMEVDEVYVIDDDDI